MRHGGLSLQHSREGSTLIWVIVVVLVLTIALGVALAATSGRFNLTATRHEQQQAYYTALSATSTVSEWLMSGSTEASALLAQIPGPGDNPTSITIDKLGGLPITAGSCSVNLAFTDAEKTKLKILSTAIFSSATQTVSLTLQHLSVSESPKEDCATVVAQAKKKADELLKLPIGDPFDIGDFGVYGAGTRPTDASNADNLGLLNQLITSTGSPREAWWTYTYVVTNPPDGLLKSDGTKVLATRRPFGDNQTTVDTRRFIAPKNGRLLVNPIERGPVENANGPTGAINTKITSLAIDTTNAVPNQPIRLRLSGNPNKKAGTGSSTSFAFHNALLSLAFDDKASDLTTTKVSNDTSYSWHPMKWAMLDVYTLGKSDSWLTDTNLIIGPFAHANGSTASKTDLDYASQGNYVDGMHGQQPGEALQQWPFLSTRFPNKPYSSSRGLPYFPVDYGPNANFFILDGVADGAPNTGSPHSRDFRILQGVNIFDGTIYSTRSTILGGGLIRAASGTTQTTDNINSDVLGFVGTPKLFSPERNDQTISYVNMTTRYSQLLKDTDIILATPSTTATSVKLGTNTSLIRRPSTWRDRLFSTDTIPSADREFEPTMVIDGGHIYVGEGQQLTIEGTVSGAKSATDATEVPLDNMRIAPSGITVDKGGVLILAKSATTNVMANITLNPGAKMVLEGGARMRGNIFVAGGTLSIKAGAVLTGNIYCFNGGLLELTEPFTLNSLYDKNHDGIFIYGGSAVGKGSITSAGKLQTTNPPPKITGITNPVHLVGAGWSALVAKPAMPSNSTSRKKLFASILCAGHNTNTGQCPGHSSDRWPGDGGDWKLNSDWLV
ncbi:MAG: polymer-forming cytoskeletal protein, partial [Coriobacteriales bacterium]|nr:polymer-forming cytoskeletal protein [Coriobacteriales bacterium]